MFLTAQLIGWVPFIDNPLKEILKRNWNETNRTIFLCKLVLHRTRTELLKPLQLCLQICRDFHNRKSTPRYFNDTGSRLCISVIRRVAHTPRICDTANRYGESATEFLKWKLSRSVIQRLVDSPYRWYGEPSTLHISVWRVAIPLQWYGKSLWGVGYWFFKKKTLQIGDTETCQLSISVIWGSVNCAYQRFDESPWEVGFWILIWKLSRL